MLSIESDFESQALKGKCISESKEISAQWLNYRFMSSLAAQSIGFRLNGNGAERWVDNEEIPYNSTSLSNNMSAYTY